MAICLKKLNQSDFLCDTCDNSKCWNKCIFKVVDKDKIIDEVDRLCDDILNRRLFFLLVGYVCLFVFSLVLGIAYYFNIISLYVVGFIICFLSYNLFFISVVGLFLNKDLSVIKKDIGFHISKRVVVDKKLYDKQFDKLNDKYDVISGHVTGIIFKWDIVFNIVFAVIFFSLVKYLLYVAGVGIFFVVFALIFYFRDIKDYFMLKKNKKILEGIKDG